MRIVTNWWGWSPRGLLIWIRYGWSLLPEAWGIEDTFGTYTLQRKWLCFAWSSRHSLTNQELRRYLQKGANQP